jgi:lysophospholipase L1-like esterase
MPAVRLLSLALVALVPAALHALPGGARAATACTGEHWVAGWLASPSDAATGGFENQTLRAIVTPHLGATQARVRLSNRFGTQSVTFDRVVAARRLAGAAVVAGTSAPVTFAGATSVAVPAGQEVVSDPVAISFNAFDDLAVSMYFSTGTGPATEHFIGRQTSYATPEEGSGDHTGDESGDAFSRLGSTAHYFLTGIDVLAPAALGAVVAFGDSITDGYEGSPSPLSPNLEGLDANGAYPDALQRRLLLTQGAPPLVVLNAGITGNRVLADGLIAQHGPKALDRLRPDALDAAGVTDVIVLAGINDIGVRSATADQVIAGLADLVAQVRASGRRALLGTLTPSAGAQPSTYGDLEAEAARQRVNAWIRSSGAADAVVDFDAALRDPSDPSRLLGAYDSGDHLHPNLAGYRAMADAVPLAQLRGTGCPATPATPRACRRTATVHVPARDRRGLRRATVLVDGQRAGVITRPHRGVRVALSGRAGRTTVTVRIRIERSGRRTVSRVRRFVRCAPPVVR